ncbi:NO-inducible flavohemoprotein [Billgrantia desiderata]|uniref:nitric oxide dioxygenase n=1 Tax=Billgrantia desiderata TaxID=52021 RepID=A0AAW4YUE3_9GAMM|nr:NO-inducible flavohemoprotein [Halomonas desiderata]MCE8013772.1 NO-inducible flavohemoprotein [Halomonas desiderata]MCE8030487.1 NO-inducible flavohemoprotein [Halomonas desiderata]MCE8043752.1 NO-inducible flavohemoprotein [Halomonas desiderata]MCE8048326.1 NO-inducible flavohemoprotein [Halomonas desiderata]MCE8052131.1 NO-inducible flavohemoprotein [Halomonas desiderata]
MLTQQQEQLIETTAPVVAQHLEAITQRFYPLMFARYPEVASLFNAAHQQSGAQQRALAGAVLAYVQLRQDPAKAREVLGIVVEKHVSLGIQPDQYPIVGECLMAAIGEVLGEAVTPDIANAWSALYGELAGLLIELEEQRYRAFAEQPGGWRGLRRFCIAATRQESAMIRSFVLEPEDGGPVADHAPGQYIGVRLTIEGEPVYRHYSLSDIPNGRSYRVSIKREAEGRVSRHFHDVLAVGDSVDLLPPAGELILADGEEPLLLASGGVGQTPMLPLARQALSRGRRVVYLHAALDAEHHAFRKEVEALRQAHPSQFQAVAIHERGDAGDHIGRIDRELLERYLPAGKPRCYFVGPQGFMSAIDEALAELGVEEERRHFEHFGPSRPLDAA